MLINKNKWKPTAFPNLHKQEQENSKLPDGITSSQLLDKLEIAIDWKITAGTFKPYFALCLNIFLMIFCYLFYSEGVYVAIIGLLPFILLGWRLLYQNIGLLFNTTFITIDKAAILIAHKPINFLSQKDDYLPTKEIAQLFVKSYEIAKENESPIYAWGVYVEMKNKEIRSLVKDLPNIWDARFVEQEIEQYLDITDRPVKGEWEETGNF